MFPVIAVAKADDIVAGVHQAIGLRPVALLLLWIIMALAVDVDGGLDAAALIDKVGPGLAYRYQLLRGIGQAQASIVKGGQPVAFQVGIAAAHQAGQMLFTRGRRPQACLCLCQVQQPDPDGFAIEELMLALVAIAQQTVIAGSFTGLAGFWRAQQIFAVGREMADFQRPPRYPGKGKPVSRQLVQRPRAAFRRFIKEQLIAPVAVGQRLGSEFPVFELVFAFDGAFERSLQRCHLLRIGSNQRLEKQAVAAVIDIGDDSLSLPAARILLVSAPSSSPVTGIMTWLMI